MSVKRYLAYTRVSTTKQGEKGSSLMEQKSIIDSYAKREHLHISGWHEERVTAAKVGRTVFKQMMQVFARGGAEGLILHKIDRGARNLKDWAMLSELTDKGIDVRIAGDSIDMTSRGGRLSADIQAVVAADYIRNLREEVKKGQRGRLRQGLYPWAAPFGYLNSGKGGTVKQIDPITAPLVRRAFEEYATGRHTLHTLTRAMYEWGVRTSSGRPLSLSRVNVMLRRSFYIGLIQVKGESFLGNHEPLISKALFDQVQRVLDGRSSERVVGVESYALRRILKCRACDRYLYAETQKGHRYYRCHSKGCRGTCVRESALLDLVVRDIQTMGLSEEFVSACEVMIEEKAEEIRQSAGAVKGGAELAVQRNKDQLARLTDAYLDRALDREEFEERRRRLLDEKLLLAEKVRDAEYPDHTFRRRASVFLELIGGLRDLAEMANSVERRELLLSAVSNFVVSKKSFVLQWRESLQLLLGATPVLECAHAREGHRTSAARGAPRARAELVMQTLLEDAGDSALERVATSGSPDVQAPLLP